MKKKSSFVVNKSILTSTIATYVYVYQRRERIQTKNIKEIIMLNSKICMMHIHIKAIVM